MSEKPRPVVISPGGARRDSLVGRGHGDGAMRGLRAGAFNKIASREDAQPATDDALLPRSPTGLADGFGARECAAELALRSPRRRAVARAASLGPPLPNSQDRRGFGPIFSCDDSVADPAAFCQQAGKRPRNPAAPTTPQIRLFPNSSLLPSSSLLPRVCSRFRRSCSHSRHSCAGRNGCAVDAGSCLCPVSSFLRRQERGWGCAGVVREARGGSCLRRNDGREWRDRAPLSPLCGLCAGLRHRRRGGGRRFGLRRRRAALRTARRRWGSRPASWAGSGRRSSRR